MFFPQISSLQLYFFIILTCVLHCNYLNFIIYTQKNCTLIKSKRLIIFQNLTRKKLSLQNYTVLATGIWVKLQLYNFGKCVQIAIAPRCKMRLIFCLRSRLQNLITSGALPRVVIQTVPISITLFTKI